MNQNIHALNLNMYDCMNTNDEVLFAPASGKSTTVRIKYYL